MKTLIMLCMIVMTIGLVGCGKVVPAGHTVLILKPNGEDIIKNSGSYFAWGRDRVYFVSTQLKSYSKDIKVLCADQINMDVRFKWLGNFLVNDKNISTIRQKIEAVPVGNGRSNTGFYNLSLDSFYKVAMEDLISELVRINVSQYKTDVINDKREVIKKAIREVVLAKLKKLNYPVETVDFMITNLDFPKEVTDMRKAIKEAELRDLENAAIAKAEVAKAKRDAELASEKGKAQLVKAEADAAANRIRTSTLTPEIIMVKQIEMYSELASGPNNTTVLIPFNALGGNMQDTLLLKQAITDKKQ